MSTTDPCPCPWPATTARTLREPAYEQFVYSIHPTDDTLRGIVASGTRLDYDQTEQSYTVWDENRRTDGVSVLVAVVNASRVWAITAEPVDGDE